MRDREIGALGERQENGFSKSYQQTEINILLMKYVAKRNWGRVVHPDSSAESFSSVCLVNSFETLQSAAVVRMKQYVLPLN